MNLQLSVAFWGVTSRPICGSLYRMNANRDAVPGDIAALNEALIAQQKLQIAKLKHQIYGQRSERSSRLIEQLALTLEELDADAAEDELARERAVAKTTTVRGFTRASAPNVRRSPSICHASGW